MPMSKLRFLLPLIAGATLDLFLPAQASASNKGYRDFACPASVAVTQRAQGVPADWRTFADRVNTPTRLTRVAFYDGPPEQMASLMPDNPNGDPQWNFAAPTKERRIWQVCIYSNTTVQLARALPPEITVCRVTPEGPGVIYAVLCR